MNIVILIAVVVQLFVSKKSRLWGSILSLLITLGILVWGAVVYMSGFSLSFLGFALSPVVFYTIFLLWTAYDVYVIIQDAKAANRTKDLRVSEETRIYPKMDVNAGAVRTVMKGDEITIRTQMKTAKGVNWYAVANPATDGKEYILSTLPVLRKFKLMQDEVYLFRQPDRGSEIIERLEKEDHGEIIKTVKGKDGDWVKVSTIITEEGYMPGETKVKFL